MLGTNDLLQGRSPEQAAERLERFLSDISLGGTTAAAAKSLSRRYIGIALNPDYCDLAKQRIGGEEA